MIEVESRQQLGEWLGQCKYDKSGVPRKVKGASSVAIKDYGETSEALTYVENYIKEHDLWTIFLIFDWKIFISLILKSLNWFC